jgi:hypothetical protein
MIPEAKRAISDFAFATREPFLADATPTGGSLSNLSGSGGL